MLPSINGTVQHVRLAFPNWTGFYKVTPFLRRFARHCWHVNTLLVAGLDELPGVARRRIKRLVLSTRDENVSPNSIVRLDVETCSRNAFNANQLVENLMMEEWMTERKLLFLHCFFFRQICLYVITNRCNAKIWNRDNFFIYIYNM